MLPVRLCFAALVLAIEGCRSARPSAVGQPAAVEIALVANAEAGTVALVDVATRAIVGTINVNPAGTKSVGPGRPNYAQDTDLSRDGHTV